MRSLIGLAEMQRFRKERLGILIPLPLQRLSPPQRKSTRIAMGLRISPARQSAAAKIPCQENQAQPKQSLSGRDRPTHRLQPSVHRFHSPSLSDGAMPPDAAPARSNCGWRGL
jgi:hypothetical protein